MTCFNRFLPGTLMAICLFAQTGLAHAGRNINVVYRPVSAVPGLGNVALVALALLLLVLALRMLRSSGRGQQMLSLVLLGGGVIAAGVSINETLAGGSRFTVPHTSPDRFCDGGVIEAGDPFHGGSTVLNNECDVDLVLSASTEVCSASELVYPMRVVPAKTEGPMPYCSPH